MVDIAKEKRLNSQCKEEPKPVTEENRTATGFKSVRVNYWEINQVTSECQMDVLDKTCRQKTKKVNPTIEFFILELVQEPNFCLNCQSSVFGKKKMCIHIRISLGTKFLLKLSMFSFWQKKNVSVLDRCFHPVQMPR